MSLVDESGVEPMPTDMLEDIRDRIQSHPRINRREACYNIRDCIKQMLLEWKGVLLSKQNMVKGSNIFLRLLLMNFHNHYQSWENQA